VGRGTWQQAIEGLKAKGKIRSFGVSINDHQPENALELVRSGVAGHGAGDLQRLRPES
jgi:hypothetical protein